MKNIKKLSIKKPDIIISSFEAELSLLFSEILGILLGRPIILIFNSVPFSGWIGSGSNDEWRKVLKHLLKYCDKNYHIKKEIRSSIYCYINSIARVLITLFILALGRFFKKRIMAIAITPYIAIELRKHGITVINEYPGNGIDVRINQSLDNKIYDACYIAHPIHMEKGVLDTLYIWRILTRKNPMAKLIIAGKIAKDFSENKLRKYIQRLDLDENIDLQISYEAISRDEILNIMSHCKVFLYPTRKDVWPLVISEALSRGLPVITYMLHNIEYAYGWCPAVKLIRIGNISEVANEILKLIQNDTRLLSMSNTALECAKKMSWKKTALLEAKAILKALKYYYSK